MVRRREGREAERGEREREGMTGNDKEEAIWGGIAIA